MLITPIALGGIEPLGGADQVALGFAVSHVGNGDGWFLVSVDDLALSVREPLRNARRQIGVQIIGIDFDVTIGGVEFLPLDGLPDRGRRRLRGFFDRLLPQEDLEVGRLERMMRHRLRILDERTIALDERFVAIGVDGLKIWERSVASDRIFRAHRRDLDFGSDGGANRQLVVRQSLIPVFTIEGDH